MMLVEINLLPQKEPKKFSFLITLSCFLTLFILIGGYYFWQSQTIKDELTSLNRQIEITKKIADKENQNSEIVASSSSVSQLKSAIEFANDLSIQTVPIMQHLTSLLPERGFIKSFGYIDTGAVTLSVQFDSTREAAFFLDSLNHANWIKEASLNSLASAQSETETNATSTTVASNSQANTTSTSTSANQTTTDPNTTVAGQTNTGSGTTTNQINQNDTTGTTTNENMVNNTTSGASTSTTKKSASNYLPRYTGQFEIKFDKDEIKKILKKS